MRVSESSETGPGKTISEWLDVRLPVKHLAYEHLSQKSVPSHKHSWVYNLGGLTLCAFLIQLATGLLLMLYYQPTSASAHGSVQFITTMVSGGSLIRNLHDWSANAMVLFLFLHAATVALTRAYRTPRELSWLTGVLSMFVTLGLAFSGYLLPWNTLAVYATKVGTEILQVSTDSLFYPLSEAGSFAARLLVGSEGVGQQTLSRFYALHVCGLPLLLLTLAGVHLLLVQLHGLSIPLSISKQSSADEPFFPEFALKECGIWLCFAGALVILAVLLPYDSFIPYTLSSAFDPLAAAPTGIKPEWYFYFLYYPLEILPRPVAISGSLVFFLAVALTPWLMVWLPRLWGATFERSKFPTVAAAAVIGFLFALTVFGEDLVRAVRGWH
jgi:cytochrome b6